MTTDHRSLAHFFGAALLLAAPSACSSSDVGADRVEETDAGPKGGASEDSGTGTPTDGVQEGILAVWGAAADDIWAVGIDGVMAHYDGTEWTEQPRVTTHNLLGVAGSSSTDVWVSGDDVILHYDGAAWDVVIKEPIYEQLPGIAVRGENDVWMAGIATDVGSAVLRHFDGEHWDVAVPNGIRSFWDVWSSESGVVWTGGSALDGTGVLARGEGTAFDVVPDYAGQSLRALWGAGDDDLWISPYEGPFEHWDGAHFEHEFGQSPVTILGMGGASHDHVWAVGLEGTILRFDGTSWGAEDSGVTTNLTAMWAAADDDAWISGSKGVLLHYDGESWSRSTIKKLE